MTCIYDNGTCGLGGFCRQCPNLEGEDMTDITTVNDLELWAKESNDPLVSEGYLMAAKTIEVLTNAIKEIAISHEEPKDYGWYTECNGCGENLDKNKHDDDCPFVLAGVIK